MIHRHHDLFSMQLPWLHCLYTKLQLHLHYACNDNIINISLQCDNHDIHFYNLPWDIWWRQWFTNYMYTPKRFADTTSVGLLRSSLDCRWIGLPMPVLLFLTLGWDLTRVRRTILKSAHLQAFIVVGGWNGSSSLSSVETLLPGATSWTPLASLPRALRNAQASIVGGRIRVNGGRDGGGSYISQVLMVQCTLLLVPMLHIQGVPKKTSLLIFWKISFF